MHRAISAAIFMTENPTLTNLFTLLRRPFAWSGLCQSTGWASHCAHTVTAMTDW